MQNKSIKQQLQSQFSSNPRDNVFNRKFPIQYSIFIIIIISYMMLNEKLIYEKNAFSASSLLSNK